MRNKRVCLAVLFGVLAAACLVANPVFAAGLEILLPLDRTAYQTNERIDIGIVRESAEPLAANNLVLSLIATDGSDSRMSFTFPVAAVPVVGGANGNMAPVRAGENLLVAAGRLLGITAR